MPVILDGSRRVVTCGCKIQAKKEQDLSRPGGFESLSEILARSPEVRGLLTETDRRVAAMVEQHVGKSSAIRIREIAGVLWPGTSMDPKRFEELARQVKASLERLVTLAGMRIASTKESPGGLFIPATAAEATEYAERLFGEGVKLILRARRFDSRRDWVRELEGQLRLR